MPLRYLRLFILFFIYILVSKLSYTQNDTIYLKLEKGEGIYSLLTRNNINFEKNIDLFFELNKDNIKSDSSLYIDREYFFVTDNKNSEKVIQQDTIWLKIDKGDDIFTVLRNNNCYSKTNIELFMLLNNNNISEDASLSYDCKYFLINNFNLSDTIPKNNTTDSTNKKDKKEEKSGKLKGATIILVSGHGGPDPGAVVNIDGIDIAEDEYAYDICMRLKNEIEAEDGKVFMLINDANDSIRTDKYLRPDKTEKLNNQDIPSNQNARLKQRCDAVNNIYKNEEDKSYIRTVFIHLDSRTKYEEIDAYFFYYPKSAASRDFATSIREVFRDKYEFFQPNRGYTGEVNPRELYVLRNTSTIATLLELANMTNKVNHKRFLNHLNRAALAKWIKDGIVSDFEKQD